MDMYASGLYTVGGLMMMLFLSACAAKGDNASEGPTPSIQDRLATEAIPVTERDSRRHNDSIPLAG